MKTEEFTQVEATEADDALLGEIAAVIDVIDHEVLPDDPVLPAAEYIADVRATPSYSRQFFWLARDGGRLIGFSMMSAEFKEENKHLARTSARILPEFRGTGLGKRLLVPAVEAAKGYDRTLVDSWCYRGHAGEEFARAMGAAEGIEGYVNRLSIDELDRALLEDWVERAKERADGYSLSFYVGATPSDKLEEVSALMRVMNTAPHDDYVEDEQFLPEQVAEFEQKAVDSGWVPWTLLSRGPEGDLAGYTRIYPNPFRPQILYQEDTGVMPEHRDRGLGRWLKAAMLLKVLEDLPEVTMVETGNATSNKPMLGINNALGFKPVLTWVKYSMPADDLLARLRG